MKLRFEATVEDACVDAYDVVLNDVHVGMLHLENEQGARTWFLYQTERARVTIAGDVREDVAQKCVRAYLLGVGLDVPL